MGGGCCFLRYLPLHFCLICSLSIASRVGCGDGDLFGVVGSRIVSLFGVEGVVVVDVASSDRPVCGDCGCCCVMVVVVVIGCCGVVMCCDGGVAGCSGGAGCNGDGGGCSGCSGGGGGIIVCSGVGWNTGELGFNLG